MSETETTLELRLPGDLLETLIWYASQTGHTEAASTSSEAAQALVVEILRDWLRMEAGEPTTATEWIRSELRGRVETWS